MATISSRNSVLGVVTEVTQNLLRVPQAATDYVPLQEDFSIEPNYDQIENLEIKASIGRAASIQGGENPTASLSFYLKGSGTEGGAAGAMESGRVASAGSSRPRSLGGAAGAGKSC